MEGAMRFDTSQGPMGKIYSVSEDAGGEGATMAALTELVQRSGKGAKEARQHLIKLVEQIPDEELRNFVGAQVSVVS
jgi:hypothetical protein